jgi:Fucose permease
MKDKKSFFRYEGVNYLLPFLLITSCFALWGFANDITNPMVKAFSKIFRMSVTQGTLTQMAFYGGYFAMALPAALFIRRFSYKSGILMGLGLYAAGAFLFIAARSTGSYWPFLLAISSSPAGSASWKPAPIRTSWRWATRKRPPAA